MAQIKRFNFLIFLTAVFVAGITVSSFSQQDSDTYVPQDSNVINDDDATLIYNEEDGIEPEIEQFPQAGGYLTEGVSTYGVQENVIDSESPLMELKSLRKKYFLELKRKSVIEEENRVLRERLYSFEKLVKEKETDFNAMQRRAIDAEFRYVALGQKLTNFRMAILRKKMLRESQYPVWYEVKKNDSLWRIAGRKEIYDNNLKWIEIYYSNQNKIADPDYIYPGMILKISRPTLEYEDWTVEGLKLDELQRKMGIENLSDFDVNNLSTTYNGSMIYPVGKQKNEQDNEALELELISDNDGLEPDNEGNFNE